jgi:hypothetical protein
MLHCVYSLMRGNPSLLAGNMRKLLFVRLTLLA